MTSSFFPQIVMIEAHLLRAGERVYPSDEPMLALPRARGVSLDSRGNEAFSSWEDHVGDLVPAQKPADASPTSQDGVFRLDDGLDSDHYPTAEDFWRIDVTHVGQVIGDHQLPLSDEASMIGWHEILDPDLVRREIESLVLGSPRGSEHREAASVTYMALVEITYSTYHGADGTEYDSSVDYRGRIDPSRLATILAAKPSPVPSTTTPATALSVNSPEGDGA